jgi:hypothetical protein
MEDGHVVFLSIPITEVSWSLSNKRSTSSDLINNHKFSLGIIRILSVDSLGDASPSLTTWWS